MADLKNYPGNIVIRGKRVGSWMKHNAVSLGIIACGALAVIWFVGSKMIYVWVDNTKADITRTYTPGAQVLYTGTAPDPVYEYSQPMTLQIFCVDGEKFIVFNQLTAHKLEGYCE